MHRVRDGIKNALACNYITATSGERNAITYIINEKVEPP